MTIDPKIHIGEIHGIYYISDVLPEKDKYGHWIYDCICTECGYHKYSHHGAIAGEKSVTTICNHKRANGEYLTYGHKWNNKRIGRIFKGMFNRCYNQNDKSYRWYGAKGIKICDEWRSNPESFEQWAVENGYNDNLTIDRKKEEKDYCPENCRWITLENNAKYKSTTKVTIVDGISHTGKEWASECNLGCNTINLMLRQYPEDKVIEFIHLRLQDKTKQRKSKQTWFDVYGIDTIQN